MSRCCSRCCGALLFLGNFFLVYQARDLTKLFSRSFQGEGLIKVAGAEEGPLTPQPSPEESCQNIESAMASETEQLARPDEEQALG